MPAGLPKQGSAADRPEVECVTLGPFETNCYVVSIPGDAARACWIVDASFEPEELIALIRGKGLRPVALVLTHAHVDHIAGIGEVRAAFPGLPILLHEAEREWLGDPVLNLSAMMAMDVTAPGPDRLLADGDRLELAGTTWDVLHTPGHSPGGITLHHAGWHGSPSREGSHGSENRATALVGDTLFNGSIGRFDFPGSDEETLVRSIRDRLYALPDQTRVFPGHGPPTTIGREKRSNPFVRA